VALSRVSSLGGLSRGRGDSIVAGLQMGKVDEAPLLADQEARSNSRKPSLSGGLAGMVKNDTSNRRRKAVPSIPVTSRLPSDLTCPSPEAPHIQVKPGYEAPLYDSEEDEEPCIWGESPVADEVSSPSTSPLPQPPILLSPSEISMQLPMSLAALRRSSLMTALEAPVTCPVWHSSNDVLQSAPPPILVNAACSGYFLEPVG